MKKRFLVGLLVASLLLATILPASIVLAQGDPTVTITVTAQVISITNTQSTWVIGIIEAGGSAIKWGGLDTYSQIENTGNVAVDIEVQGTDVTGSYPWTLAATAGDKIYSLMTNTEGAPTVYTLEVTSSVYNDLTTALAPAGTYQWSMEFTPPTIFDAADDGLEKSATITLVASKS